MDSKVSFGKGIVVNGVVFEKESGQRMQVTHLWNDRAVCMWPDVETGRFFRYRFPIEQLRPDPTWDLVTMSYSPEAIV